MNGFEPFLNEASLVRVAPLCLLPTEQQEDKESIYNRNSLTQIDLKPGIIGGLESLDERWCWAERGGNEEEQSPTSCRRRSESSFHLLVEAPHLQTGVDVHNASRKPFSLTL